MRTLLRVGVIIAVAGALYFIANSQSQEKPSRKEAIEKIRREIESKSGKIVDFREETPANQVIPTPGQWGAPAPVVTIVEIGGHRFAVVSAASGAVSMCEVTDASLVVKPEEK